jgi:hypothetical protein
MTVKRLQQLQYIRKLIEKERERVADLRESLGTRSPVISDMPKGSGARDKLGEVMPVIVDKEAGIADLLQKLEAEERILTDWIMQTSPKIQLICRLRFIDGLSWEDVADALDTGNGVITGDGCRMALNNFLKKWNQDHPEEEADPEQRMI